MPQIKCSENQSGLKFNRVLIGETILRKIEQGLQTSKYIYLYI